MRPGALAVVSLVSAVIGGLVVLGLGAATGRLGEGTTETVVIPSSRNAASVEQPATIHATAGPLPGDDFDPAKL